VKVWAIMPVKPLVRAKSRLASVLTPEQRRKLSLGMMSHNLSILKEVPSITGVLVISRDGKVLSIARELGAKTVQESGNPELNSALLRATELLKVWGAESILILPSDLPLLSAEDVEQIVHLGRFTTSIVIAPDKDREGTNALLIHPPGLITYSYGIGSFDRHVANAQLEGAEVHIYESDRLALDLDTPEDIEEYIEMATNLGLPLIDFEIEDSQGESIFLAGQSLQNRKGVGKGRKEG